MRRVFLVVIFGVLLRFLRIITPLAPNPLITEGDVGGNSCRSLDSLRGNQRG